MTRVLVLRPEPGASATMAKARALGLDAVAVPLFEIQPVAWDVPEASAFDGLLLTSANAVRHGGEGLNSLRGLPAYAVGQATARAAREAGFDVAAVGDAGVDQLLELIRPDVKLLQLCGLDHRVPDAPRQEIVRIAVHQAAPVEDPDLSAAENSVALIHSPRAGERFAELVTERGTIATAAISDAAADAVGGGWRAIGVAARPNDAALLALAASLCEKPDPE